MRKSSFIILCNLFSVMVFSQVNETEKDTTSIFTYKLDITSRYLWRGQCWGGDYVAVQPTITFTGIEDWEFELWATTNFKDKYAYSDNTVYKGYQEIDFSVSYSFNDYTFVQISDYYWPSVEKVDGMDNGYFNYGRNGVKTLDFSFNIDRAEEHLDYPFKATISTLIAGNDFRYSPADIDHEGKGRQNFTTYIEVGYSYMPFKEKTSKKFLQNIELNPVVGAVLNNYAEYYSYADYDKPSLCNMGITVVKKFEIGQEGKRKLEIPVSLNYTHNAASKNTADFGRNFLVATLSFEY